MADLHRTIDRSINISRSVADVLQRRTRTAEQALRRSHAQRRCHIPERAHATQDARSNSGGNGPNTASTSRSARLFTGTRCASAATSGSNTRPRASRRCSRTSTKMIADARDYERPANHALVRIIPPAGVVVDDAKRPFVIVDPRAGHGPGIGGSRRIRKSASLCPPAIRSTSSSSIRTRCPGQTLRRCHATRRPNSSASSPSAIPDSQKPVIVGNCQGGWAVMMLAAARPDDCRTARASTAHRCRTGPATTAIRRSAIPAASWAARGCRCSRPTWARASSTARTSSSEFRAPESREHALGQVVPPVRQHRHRAGALPRIRALVGRLLCLINEEEIRWIVNNLFVGNKLSAGEATAQAGPLLRPEVDQAADHRVRVDGRQHHAAAAGVQLDRRRLFVRPRKSRPTARPSSACCTRTSDTSASSCPARSRRRNTRRSSRC